MWRVRGGRVRHVEGEGREGETCVWRVRGGRVRHVEGEGRGVRG